MVANSTPSSRCSGVIKDEPQSREFPSGHYVACAYINYRKNKKNRDTGQWEAEYHGWDCEFWGDPKKFVGVVIAGDALVVRGRMKVDRWEDKGHGEAEQDSSRRSGVRDRFHEADRMEPRQTVQSEKRCGTANAWSRSRKRMDTRWMGTSLSDRIQSVRPLLLDGVW